MQAFLFIYVLCICSFPKARDGTLSTTRVVRVIRECCCQALAKREEQESSQLWHSACSHIQAANLLKISQSSLYRLLKKVPEQMPSGGCLEQCKGGRNGHSSHVSYIGGSHDKEKANSLGLPPFS